MSDEIFAVKTCVIRFLLVFFLTAKKHRGNARRERREMLICKHINSCN